MKKGAVAGKFYIKSCGKKHAYCKVCKPDRKNPHDSGRVFGFRDKEVKEKCRVISIKRGIYLGSKNPNWRGGRVGYNLAGWKKMRELVWERDIVCRACCKPPYRNRRLDVHHINPRRNNGVDSLDNLVGLHHACHMKVEVGKLKIVSLEVCQSQAY